MAMEDEGIREASLRDLSIELRSEFPDFDVEHYRLALANLRQLGRYQPHLYYVLQLQVLRQCELARHYRKDFDPLYRERQRDTEVIKQIPSQINSIKKICTFLDNYQDYAGWPLIWAYHETGFKITTSKEINLTHALSVLLKKYEKNLTSRPVAKSWGPPHRFQVGPLIYGRPIDRHTARPSVATCLLFVLVFYFRKFSSEEEHFRGVMEGDEMPSDGKPHYDVAADFVGAATGEALGTPQQVRGRLEKLIKENPGLGLGSWPKYDSCNPNFAQE